MLLDDILLLLGRSVSRVSTNGLVNVSPHSLNIVSGDASSNVLRELLLVLVVVALLQLGHVLGNVASVDVLAENTGVELTLLGAVTGEAFDVVGDFESTVSGTLHGSKNLGTSGGGLKTNIKDDIKRAALLSLFDNEVLAISLGDTSVELVHAKLLEGTAGDKKTSRVSSGVVLETRDLVMRDERTGIGRRIGRKIGRR